jgi:hypothetical protein
MSLSLSRPLFPCSSTFPLMSLRFCL